MAALTAMACSSPDDRPPPTDEAIVVASFDFAESRIVAELYAQALEARGYAVRRELDLGPRELVLPALEQHLVDVVPEYMGTALEALDATSGVDPGDAAAVEAALADALRPRGLHVLSPSAASNQNVVVVTEQTADRLRAVAVSDLAPHVAGLTLGGPPECPTRPTCGLGLARLYGLHFEAFLPLDDEELVVAALADGTIDVGVLFSTDGSLAAGGLVPLHDDRDLQPLDVIAPIVSDAVAADADAVATLRAVNDQLGTGDLRFLNWRVANGATPAQEARGWLVRRGLIHR